MTCLGNKTTLSISLCYAQVAAGGFVWNNNEILTWYVLALLPACRIFPWRPIFLHVQDFYGYNGARCMNETFTAQQP